MKNKSNQSKRKVHETVVVISLLDLMWKPEAQAMSARLIASGYSVRPG